MKLKMMAVALFLALLAQSCGIDFQTKAVEKARTYALDNLKQLDETQRSFIRYTDPVIMDRVIYRVGTGSYSDMLHVCMVWNVPGVDGSVVVAGHGERSLIEWSPDRVLIEDISRPDTIISADVGYAVSFAMNRMLHLSDAERNHIRFTPPEINMTKFDIDPEEDRKDSHTLSRWEAYLKSKEKKADPVQYTFSWQLPSTKEIVAITGFSPKKGLAGWKPREGRKMDVKEFESMRISENLAPVWAQAPAVKPVPVK